MGEVNIPDYTIIFIDAYEIEVTTGCKVSDGKADRSIRLWRSIEGSFYHLNKTWPVATKQEDLGREQIRGPGIKPG